MRRYFNNASYHIPDFAVSEFSDSKKTLKARFQSIFEDDKKKRGLVVISVLLILAILASSLFIFGGKDVKQTNDSLTVYIRGINNTYRDKGTHLPTPTPYEEGYYTDHLIADYKLEYPDVNLNVVNLSELNEEQFYDKLSSEIMSGKGPDVVIGTEEFMKYRDVNKLISSGTFAELDGFMNDDPQNTFADDECFNTIMEFGKYKGKTYVVPVNFDFPIFYSPHQILDDAGVNIESCTRDYIGFAEEISKYIERIDGLENKSVFNNIDNISPFLNLMYEPERYDKDTFRKFAEMYKPIYEYDTGKDKTSDEAVEFAYQNKSTLFAQNWDYTFHTNRPITKLSHTLISTRAIDKSPTITTLNQTNGDFAANVTVFAGVNSNSANKQNAYNYIKRLAGPYNVYYSDSRFLSSNKMAFAQLFTNQLVDEHNWTDPKTNITYNYPAYTKDDINNTIRLADTIDIAYCKNPMTYETERIMLEYYKGTATLEDCLKQVDEKITIYRSE